MVLKDNAQSFMAHDVSTHTPHAVCVWVFICVCVWERERSLLCARLPDAPQPHRAVVHNSRRIRPKRKWLLCLSRLSSHFILIFFKKPFSFWDVSLSGRGRHVMDFYHGPDETCRLVSQSFDSCHRWVSPPSEDGAELFRRSFFSCFVLFFSWHPEEEVGWGGTTADEYISLISSFHVSHGVSQ